MMAAGIAAPVVKQFAKKFRLFMLLRMVSSSGVFFAY
jgi:hypothetical protein